jgi:hypothetical protein
MLALLLSLSFAHCQPPEPLESRRLYESVYLVRPTLAEGALAPRNARLFLSGPAGLLLDENAFGPPVLTLALKDDAGAEIAFTREGSILTPDALLPADATLTLEVRLTDDHPCPECTEPHDDSFMTSDIVDETIAPVGDKTRYEVTLQGASENMCFFTPERTVGVAHIEGSFSEPLFATVFGGRRGRAESLASGHLRFGAGSQASIGGTLADPTPQPGERVILAVVVEDLAGNRALSSVASVSVTHTDLANESACTLSLPSVVEAPVRVPKNAVIRTRFPVEPRTPALGITGELERPLLTLANESAEQRVFALPTDVAPGNYVLDVAACDSCVCPECAPAPRMLEILDVVDELPPASPSALAITLTERDEKSSDPFCVALGDVIELTFIPGADDTTTREDLRYDVKVRLFDGPALVLGRAFAPSADGDRDTVIVPSSYEILDAALQGQLVVELIARDLADHESESISVVHPATLGCAHVNVRAQRSLTGLLVLLAIGGVTAMRRRR